LKFQYVQRFLPTHFVHPVSSFKKDITATTVEISTVVAVFTNTFCPISLKTRLSSELSRAFLIDDQADAALLLIHYSAA
jgi:hypothetical protein